MKENFIYSATASSTNCVWRIFSIINNKFNSHLIPPKKSLIFLTYLYYLTSGLNYHSWFKSTLNNIRISLFYNIRVWQTEWSIRPGTYTVGEWPNWVAADGQTQITLKIPSTDRLRQQRSFNASHQPTTKAEHNVAFAGRLNMLVMHNHRITWQQNSYIYPYYMRAKLQFVWSRRPYLPPQ